MLRVVISAHKDFSDQRIAQQAMLQLRRLDQDALVVAGANAADKRVMLVWKVLGGRCQLIEPEFRTGGQPRLAMQARDKLVLRHAVDLCLSFEVQGQQGFMTGLCLVKNIRIQHYDSVNQVIDAD